MTDSKDESFWIEWKDPADDIVKFFALSQDTGHYWTDDTDDPNIVDGASLEIRYSLEDTVRQISEKWKMQKGKQFERYNLFQHSPSVKAWLAVGKESTGDRDEDNKLIREYRAHWSRRFKAVTCVSRITGRSQGNPKFQDKGYARQSAAKAKVERQKKLDSAQKAAKKLDFDPMKRLALYAMGDSERLGVKGDVKQSIQMKALETFLKYSHQQMKSYSPQEMEKLRGGNSGPRVNIVLPSDGSENDEHVITHKDRESLDRYIESGSLDSYSDIEKDMEIDDDGFKREYARLQLPEEDE